MRVLAVLIAVLFALPAAAQNNPQATPQNKATGSTACPEYGASSGGNNVNQAMGANTQGCADTAPNPNARTTSKGGNSGQQRHPGVSK
jgi:hypothetical protein